MYLMQVVGSFSFLVLGGCARTHTPSSTKKEKEPTLRNIFQDDSGSKLRDKEQQRLSSK